MDQKPPSEGGRAWLFGSLILAVALAGGGLLASGPLTIVRVLQFLVFGVVGVGLVAMLDRLAARLEVFRNQPRLQPVAVGLLAGLLLGLILLAANTLVGRAPLSARQLRGVFTTTMLLTVAFTCLAKAMRLRSGPADN